MPTSEPRWHRLHPTLFLFGMATTLWRTILPIIFAGFFARSSDVFLTTVVPIALMFAFSIQLLRYLSIRYTFGEGQIVIHEGLFSRHIRTIPVRRIHNINTSQHLLARLFNVVRLDIETAGGGETEASLATISKRAAAELEAFVRMHKGEGAPASDAPGEGPSELESLSVKRVLLAGATSNRIGVVAFGLILLNQYFEFLGTDRWLASIVGQAEVVARQVANMWLLATLGLLVLILGSWLFGIVTTLIRWYGFSLSRDGDDLKIRAGLFTLREYMVPLKKVQALRCKTSVMRRPFGLFQMQVLSAGRVGLQDHSRIESDILAPIAGRTDIARYARHVFPNAAWDEVAWRPVHVYTRTRHWLVLLILFALLIWPAAIWLVPIYMAPIALAVTALLAITGSFFVAHWNWRHTAFAKDDAFVYLKNGFIGLHFWVIPIAKIQNLAISESPGQRLRGLASLHLDLAGSAQMTEPDIPNIALEEAWQLFNHMTAFGRRIRPN